MKKIFLLLMLFSLLEAQSLEGVIRYALKHSVLMKQTKADIALASLNKKYAQARQYGELNLVGEYNHYNIERTLAPLVPSSLLGGGTVATSRDIFSTGLRYGVPLFTGFGQTRQIEISRIAQTMSQVKMQLTKEQLVYNIRSLYLSVLATQEIVVSQKNYLKSLRRLEKQIAYEVKIGKKATIELLKAQTNVEATISQISQLSLQIEMSKASLSALVSKEVKAFKKINIRLKKPHFNLDRLYKKSLSLGKVKMEEMALLKSKKMIEKTKSSALPQVYLSMYAGENYAQDLKTQDFENEGLWQVGVNVKYNLLDFGKQKIALQKAQVAKLKASLHQQNTLFEMKKRLIQGIQKTTESYQRYLSNTSQLKLTKKAQEIERVRYENEASTLNDLLLAQSKTQLAQAKVIQSRYSYQQSIYYIDYLMEKGVKR